MRFSIGTALPPAAPGARVERRAATGKGMASSLLAGGLLAFQGAPLAAAAEQPPLAGLLDGLAPARPAPKGSVEVVGWVERSATGSAELVVTFVPKGAVKMTADPGVTVTPQPRDGIAWASEGPVSRVETGRDYFAEPPTVRLPFAGADGRPVEASVEYAYCLVGYQCLFGEARVSAPTVEPTAAGTVPAG